MKVMSIDHSLKNNGIAIFENGLLIKTHNIPLEEDGDKRFTEFRKHIKMLIKFNDIDTVVLEKTAHLRNANILRNLIGLYMIALEASISEGCSVVTVNPKSVKKFITGYGSASKEDVMNSLNSKWNIDNKFIRFPIYYKKDITKIKEMLYDASDAVANGIYAIRELI